VAFPRIQGKRIVILHSRRESGQVKQLRLHVFATFADAEEAVESDKKWGWLCDSMKANLSGKSSFNRQRLREKILKMLQKQNPGEKPDHLQKTTNELLETMLSFKDPLTPGHIKSLKAAKESLIGLTKVVGDKLKLLDKKEEEMISFDDHGVYQENTTEDILYEGLAHYERGEWDRAKDRFMQGLKVDPNHLDLLVHAGLSELLEENYLLALSRFDRALEIGKGKIDDEIESNPGEYIKYEDFEKWAEGQVCELADECPDWGTDQCEDCDRSPVNSWTGLYSYTKFRPFFRAMTNKAVTLMRMKRYQEAIDTLLICQSYDYLFGVPNMIGECHFCLGDAEKADQWVTEMLWPEAYYMKSLILYSSGRREGALRYLLTGVTHNWHIGRMIVGIEKPEKTRYIGEALPDRLSASEHIHESRHLFGNNTGFKVMIRCVLEDPTIDELLQELEEAKRRHKEDRGYRMDRFHWNLMNGNMNDDFLDRHVPRLSARLSGKDSEYWLPEKHEMITLMVQEKKRLNWLVSLVDIPERMIYFRPNFYLEYISEGDTIKICVSKSWYYKKRLFISGEVAQ